MEELYSLTHMNQSCNTCEFVVRHNCEQNVPHVKDIVVWRHVTRDE